MRNFLVPMTPPATQRLSSYQASEFTNQAGQLNAVAAHDKRRHIVEPAPIADAMPGPEEIFTGYLSDISEDAMTEDEAILSEENATETNHGSPLQPAGASEHNFPLHPPPPLKRRRLDVPYRLARQQARDERQKQLEQALIDIEKLFESKKAKFDVGREGLQARRGQAIRSYLLMVIKNGRGRVDASQRAAEAQGFAVKWGGYLVRCWVQEWLKSRTLPTSSRGRHVKSYSLLEDPAIRAELRSFVRSNKWSMNPSKLAEFSQQRMIPAAAKKYIHHIVDDEMPKGLKHYIELELFPRIQQKVKKGISLKTARQFLRKEGFRYTEHKKALFYDGHDRPDVIAYCQNIFIPVLDSLRHRIIEYQPSNCELEVEKTPANLVERRAVLVPQDEMTAQAYDGLKRSWVLDGEQPLRKKGNGRGIHQSDVISSVAGWTKDASQSMEYGKNYEGYWNGELFIKQVSHSELHYSQNHSNSLIPNDRCEKKLSPHSNVNMDLGVRQSFSSITPRATALMQRMH